MTELDDISGEMTLRDYFAALALQGILANPQNDVSRQEAAAVAYRHADEMLKTRDQ